MTAEETLIFGIEFTLTFGLIFAGALFLFEFVQWIIRVLVESTNFLKVKFDARIAIVWILLTGISGSITAAIIVFIGRNIHGTLS